VEGVFTLLLPAYLLFAMPLAAAATARAAVGFERMTDLYRYPAAMTIAAVAIAIPIVIGGVLDVRAITHILGEA
jgi:multisubunit Na+/H+ antiporter MnhG subunit